MNSNNPFVLQEIVSQPEIWRQALTMVQSGAGTVRKISALLGKGPVFFTGCGSSYYLSQATAPLWNSLGTAESQAISATDLIAYPEAYWRNHERGTLFAISRSGNTPETCEAARYARQTLEWDTVAVTCHANTPLIDTCKETLLLADAAEMSRFTTRVLTTTILVFDALLARHLQNARLFGELLQLPDHAHRLLKRYGDAIEKFAQAGPFQDYVYLGQGPYFGLASELMLKTKEMVCTYADAFPSLEYLHGPRYAATASTLIVVLLSEGGREHQLSILPKLKELGAKVAVVCERTVPEISTYADFVLELESGLSDFARRLLVMPLMQLLAYRCAVAAGKAKWIDKMVYVTAKH